MAGLLAHGSRSQHLCVTIGGPRLPGIPACLERWTIRRKRGVRPRLFKTCMPVAFRALPKPHHCNFRICATGRPHRSTVAGSAAIGIPREAAFVAFPLRLRLPGETIQVTEKRLGAMNAHVNQGDCQATVCPAPPQALPRPDRAPDRPSDDRTAHPPRRRSFAGAPGDRRPTRRGREDRSP